MKEIKEIKAMEAFGTPYMTQAEELSIEERRYCTRASGKNVVIENYRGATIEEREKWQKELDEIYSKNNSMSNNIKE